MEESSTYQWIVRKGERRGQQELLLEQGRVKFGEAAPATAATIRAINDPDRLLALGRRLLGASSWDDLLATP